nr:putative reverse transcriptase domain-containing protein [Tanacetum cinerariifolium]
MTTHKASRGDVTPRSESTDAHKGSGRSRGSAENDDNGGNGNTGGILDIAAMISQQLRDLLPTIVMKIINNDNNQVNGNGGGGEDDTNRENYEEGHEHCNLRNGSNNKNGNGCSYKEFLASYTDRFHKLAKLVPHLVTPEFKKIDRGLTDDSVRNGLLKTSSEKRKESGENGIQEDARGNNKRTRIGKGFVETDSGKKEYKGSNEAFQDPNVMTGTFFLNDQYATVLFDTLADYSFVSTKFMPLINAKPSDLNFSCVIKMANGENEEANKIIRGCTLVLGDVPFSIDLLTFELGSFDVIIGMDLLSKLRAEIVCHERIIRIPLPNGDVLEVHGELSKENLKHLASMKANEKKLKDIPIIRDFPKSSSATYQDYLPFDQSNYE